MAYVAISQELVQRVNNNINSMRRAEVNSVCPELDSSYARDASYLFNLGCWGEHMHLMDVIPVDWLHKHETASIMVCGDVEINGDTHRIAKSANFGGLTKAYAKPSKSGGSWGDTSCRLSIEELRALPENTVGRTELIKRFEDACTEYEIHLRWDKVEREVTGFLRRCKSLNEAVKLVPSITMYLSREDIVRMERKVTRAPREELTVDIDVDAITSSAVIAKLVAAA